MNRRRRKKTGRFKPLLRITLILALVAGGGYILFKDTAGPELALNPADGVVGPETVIAVTATDPGSGLKDLSMTLYQGGKVRQRIEPRLPVGVKTFELTATLSPETYRDGPVEYEISTADASLSPLSGRTKLAGTFTLDTQAPKIKAGGQYLYIDQGGSAIVSFSLNENVAEAGVRTNDLFFPAYRQGDGGWLCLFGMPWDMAPGAYRPDIYARDKAGNESSRTFTFHADARDFKNDRLNLPMSFLERKSALFERLFPDDPETDPLGRYLKINNNMRERNRAWLFEIGRKTSPTPLWTEPFLRNSGATTATFGDNRDYYFDGVAVDNQTHLGIDLANRKQSPIRSANAGVVVFAEFLGIYGKCVVVDHGLGLQSLYAHLSEIKVKVGESVGRGQELGLSGTTGLAGGDHLHFGMLVSGLPVEPREWFDGGWVRQRITPAFK